MAALEYQDRVHLIAILTIPGGGASNSSIDNVPGGGGNNSAARTPQRPHAKYVRGDEMAGYDAILISTVEDAFTGAITVGVLADAAADPEVEANYATLQSPPGTDVTIAADKAIVLTAMPFPALAIFSAASEADIAEFFVYGVQDHG